MSERELARVREIAQTKIAYLERENASQARRACSRCPTVVAAWSARPVNRVGPARHE